MAVFAVFATLITFASQELIISAYSDIYSLYVVFFRCLADLIYKLVTQKTHIRLFQSLPATEHKGIYRLNFHWGARHSSIFESRTAF